MSLITNLHSLTSQARHLIEERSSPFIKEDTLATKVRKLQEQVEKEEVRATGRVTALRARMEARREEIKTQEATDLAEIQEIERSSKALQSVISKLTGRENGNKPS